MAKKAFTPTPKPTLEAVLDWAEADWKPDRVRQMLHCPLDHPSGDRTPSFSADLSSQVWKCHACNNGGDAWSLIMTKASVDFLGAVKIARSEGFSATDSDEKDSSGFAFGRGSTVSRKAMSPSGGPAFKPSWRR